MWRQVQLAAGNVSDTVAVAAPGLITSINGTQTGPSWSFLLGFFSPAVGGPSTSVVLTNQDSTHPAMASLGLQRSGSAATLQELGPGTGRLTTAVDDSPMLPGFQVSLLAGDARLFVFG